MDSGVGGVVCEEGVDAIQVRCFLWRRLVSCQPGGVLSRGEHDVEVCDVVDDAGGVVHHVREGDDGA